ncbi:ImmA/IrrE family metallo-endopeptidase [Corynebacterium amycolatum]|uniref:ImmA/IrrE family metallo-endopeptidase n=1 Tax=Corynebacterium amycolatum TaxID=43765 RepID=UPI003458576B
MKTPSTNELISIAEAAGVRVTWHKRGPKGAWIPYERRISLRHGMDDASTRCTMAHELAHMWLGHPAPASNKQERQADRFAAQLLVSPVEYALAEQIYEARPQLIAAELGVTNEVLAVWRGMYEKRAV